MNFHSQKPCKHTSVVYEIASMLPRTVPTINTSSPTICTDFIEEYLQHASTIDSLILLDRLRQVNLHLPPIECASLSLDCSGILTCRKLCQTTDDEEIQECTRDAFEKTSESECDDDL